MTKGEFAESCFRQGNNCAQSVALAFADEIGMDSQQIAKLTIGFGGGMGRLREVCGAVSGMTFVVSALYDGTTADIYPRVQAVANKFKDENGSVVCRELLGLDIQGGQAPTPEKRTQQYYKKRPCAELVHMAADILQEYIEENPYLK